MINQTLNNRYKITSRLGEGGMGEVFQATDSQTGQQVAVKVLARQLTAHPESLERFRREAETLRQLDHPNIVKFVDAFDYDGQFVIVMEYVSGGSLHELIKTGPLPIERARQIALDLCDALIRAHRLNIIHRDIKPENMLLAKDGTPKLADFGVARLSESTRMTRSGTQVGTPYYMAPEAWEGKTLDAQADIWSLGVVLFEMLAGQLPFGGDTGAAVMTKVLTTQPPDLKKLRADVSPGLVKIVSRMLTRDKTRRYQSIREVGVDLERSQLVTSPASGSASRIPGSYSKSKLIYAVIGILVLGVIIGVNLLSSPAITAATEAPLVPKAPTQTSAVIQPSAATDAAVVEATVEDCVRAEVFCVGLVTDAGGVNDNSFNQAAWEGVQQAKAEGNADLIQFIETVDAGDYSKNISTFADAGYDVIVTVGFNQTDATISAAAVYPDVHFIGVDQFQAEATSGVTGLVFPEDQGGFLVGALAAMMSESHKIGAVCGTDVVPPVWRFGEGYRAGAAYADEIEGITTEVFVVYHSDVGFDKTFTDPEWGAQTAKSMFDQGADVIFGCGGLTGNGAITFAAQAGKYAIGVDTDQYLTLPEAAPRMLSSAMKLITPGVADLIVAAKDGSIASGNFTGRMGYAPFHDLDSLVSAEIRAAVEEIYNGLLNGSITTNVPSSKP